MPTLLVLLAAFVMLGFLGSYLAGEKRRPAGEGFLLGFALGPLGLLIEALLPTKPAPEPAPRRAVNPAARTIARRSVPGWRPPDEVIEEQDAEAFRYLTEPE